MDPFQDWLNAPLATRQSVIAKLGHGPDDPLSLVRAPDHLGVYASLGPNFRYAVFGRDSIETAEDILDSHPQIVRNILVTLCHLQGATSNPVSEEEPGKIHHEYRAAHLDGQSIPEHSLHILHDLQGLWGGAGTDEMIYYGSHDATPLFVRLVGQYCATQGTDILDEPIVRRSDNAHLTVRACTEAAVGWLTTKIRNDTLGLFVFQRLSPKGIVNQAWKDSPTAYLHIDGSMPNYDAPVASIELQGYAYDALQTAVTLGLGSSEQREQWHGTALHLQQQTTKLLWMEEAQYFAQGLDFSNPGNSQQIATITSNPGALLDSGLLHDLPAAEVERFVPPIVRTIFSPELLSAIGVRCRAVQHWDLLGFIDYHGPNTVWPKETYDIAKGLRRAGLHSQAADLEHRLLHGLRQAGEFAEFFYVSRDGTVWYDTTKALIHFNAESPQHFIPIPEPAQAWTIAAALRIANTTQDSQRTSAIHASAAS